MSFRITCSDFNEGDEIPKKFGYKFENKIPCIKFENFPENTKSWAIIMDDPDAMGAVGKVWLHWLALSINEDPDINGSIQGKTDFGECRYGGPAPPDKRHTYIFKAYALDIVLDLKEGYSKQELEDAMKNHIIDQAKLTGTFAP